MFTISFSEEAMLELQAIYDWYENTKPGLGERILKLIEEQLEILKKNPTLYQIALKNKRALILRDFPYQIIYGTHQNQVVVYAIFHTSRNPKKWKDRK